MNSPKVSRTVPQTACYTQGGAPEAILSPGILAVCSKPQGRSLRNFQKQHLLHLNYLL
jgi:hypothetical protein